MARHRSRSVAFERQASQAYLRGERPHGLSKRHDPARDPIRIWAEKYRTGALDEDAADLPEACEARIAALDRLVGRQALERDFPIPSLIGHDP